MSNEQNLIQRGDLLQRLLRGLAIKGQRSASLNLDSTVSPVVVLEDLTRGVEPDPHYPFWFYSQRAALVAGEVSCAAVINIGPDVCLVERIQMSSSATMEFDVFTSTEAAILAATGFSESPSWADTRSAGVPPLVGTVGSAIGGVGVIENMIARTKWASGGAVTDVYGPVLLGPGKGLVVQSAVAAAGFNASFQGRVSLP